jgi:hypothetical protein
MIPSNNTLFSADKIFKAINKSNLTRECNCHYLCVTILETIMIGGHVRYESYSSTTFSHSGPRDLVARICIIILSNSHPQREYNCHYLCVTILEIIMIGGHVRYESYSSTTFSHS